MPPAHRAPRDDHTGTQARFADGLAHDAARMGLLEPETLRALLREAVRSRRLALLAEARQRVAAAGIEPMNEDEILAEIAAHRTERSAGAG
jgi:hypothetical protein